MAKRKLDTPEEIDRVCRFYYLSEANISSLARAEKVSPMTIDRIITENGADFIKGNCQEIDDYKKSR